MNPDDIIYAPIITKKYTIKSITGTVLVDKLQGILNGNVVPFDFYIDIKDPLINYIDAVDFLFKNTRISTNLFYHLPKTTKKRPMYSLTIKDLFRMYYYGTTKIYISNNGPTSQLPILATQKGIEFTGKTIITTQYDILAEFIFDSGRACIIPWHLLNLHPKGSDVSNDYCFETWTDAITYKNQP